MKHLRPNLSATILTLLILALAVPSFGSQAAPLPPKFLTPQLAGTTASPVQIAVADFDHDGKLDIAATSLNGVDVLLGNGDGTFQTAVTYKVDGSSGGWAIAAGDMNNDGNVDLVITEITLPGIGGSNGVQVLLGAGDGTFSARHRTAIAGGSPGSIAVGDFNGDGKLDVVVTVFYVNANPPLIAIFLGNGDGTLQAQQTLNAAGNGNASKVVVGDVNGDGKLDIVVAANSVDLLLGNGDGSFQSPQVLAANAGASGVTLGDVNGDGEPDIVFFTGHGISVLVNAGSGHFGGFITTNASGLGTTFALADFNGDGKLDVAVNGLGIFYGIGNGRFRLPTSYYDEEDASTPEFTVAADVNGDGHPDLLQTAGPAPSGIVVYLGGKGTFAAPQSFATPATTTSLIALGDFNNDKKLDLAALNAGSVGILLGNGNGTFQNSLQPFNATGAEALATGDFNNDKNLDLAVLSNSSSSEVQIFRGNGDGTFQAPLSYPTGDQSVAIMVADFNRDGNLDIAVVNTCVTSKDCTDGVVSVLLGNGDGTFKPPVNYDVGTTPNSIAMGDFNRDGIPDLVVANTGTGVTGGDVSLLLGKGDGTFTAATSVVSCTNPTSILVGDFNGDGNLDLVAMNDYEVAVIPGAGNGSFKSPVFTAGNFLPGMEAADMNGDGQLDLVMNLGIFEQEGPTILLGLGNGSFQTSSVLLFDQTIKTVEPALLGNDKLPDLVVGVFQNATQLARSVVVIRNVGQ